MSRLFDIYVRGFVLVAAALFFAVVVIATTQGQWLAAVLGLALFPLFAVIVVDVIRGGPA